VFALLALVVLIRVPEGYRKPEAAL
jgi:hypothetical protein